MSEPSTSQIQHPNNERTPLISNSTSTPPPPLRVNPRKRTLWPWIILVTLVVIANIVVLFLLFEGVGTDTRQHFVDSYDPKSILKHIKVFEHIKAANRGGITLGKGFNTSIDYIYNSIGKDSPCILYKQQFIVPNWELNKSPTFAKAKGDRKQFKLGEDFIILPFGGKSTRIGSTRVLSVQSKECNADHYFGLKGRVAIIPHDPACNLYRFTKSAQDMGAIAVAYYTPKGQTDLLSNYTLLPKDWDKGVELIHIPTLSISFETMRELLEDELNSKVSITLDSIQEVTTSQNLICHVPGKDLDLEYGNPASVIAIGGHLDSYYVDESLGIESKEVNNISAASILLEIVNTVKRSQFKPFNHLYFVWFGSRSFHSYGANHFISNLNKNQPLTFNRTLMFLNLENLDNQVPQVYDGKSLKFPSLRKSSSFLTRIMEEHFKENSLKYELVPINKRSGQDSLAFLDYGIPVGGLTSGEDKSIDDGTDKEDGLNLKTLNNCAESLITNIGALAVNEHLKEIMSNY